MLDITQKIQQYENGKGVYNSTQVDKFLFEVDKGNTIKTNKKIEYYNIPCCFDIETTSFYEEYEGVKEKRSIMYEWTLCINWVIIVGRTWEEFLNTYNRIVEWFDTYERRRLIIYVHNLSFEFQAFRKLFKWDKVFSLSERKPVQALTEDGIEFRCSYILSGYSLAKLSDQLQKYKVKKKVGDLDYSLIRHSETPLTFERSLLQPFSGECMFSHSCKNDTKYFQTLFFSVHLTSHHEHLHH